MIPYGKRLIELRGEKSQEEAAKDIGIATSTLEARYSVCKRSTND